MRIRIAVPEDYVEPAVINAGLEAVTRIDQAMIRAGDAPLFNPSSPGVQWKPEPPGDEHFDNVQTVIQRGWGDCDDLAPWRAASLRQTGEDPGAVAIVVPSGPSMFHAIVRRSDGTNDDPSVAAGMRAKSVVGDGESCIYVWACDPHDGRIYQGGLAPTVAPLEAHCGPTWAVRPITETIGRHTSVVGYEGRVDCPVVGSRMGRMRRHHPRRHHGHHGHHGHTHHVHQHLHVGFAPYALSCTAGGRDCSPAEALAVACAGAVHAGVCAGTASREDHYKLFAMHHLLAGHHPSQTVIELAKLMAQDHAEDTAQAYAVHGYHGQVRVGSFGSFLKAALQVVTAVSPALSAIPFVGPVLSSALPIVNMVAQPLLGHQGAPQPGLSPQPQALAAAQPVGPVIRAVPYRPGMYGQGQRPAPPPPSGGRPAPPPPQGYAPPQQAAPAPPGGGGMPSFSSLQSAFQQASTAFDSMQDGTVDVDGDFSSEFQTVLTDLERASSAQVTPEDNERYYGQNVDGYVAGQEDESFDELQAGFEHASAAYDALSTPLAPDDAVDVPEGPSFDALQSSYEQASAAFDALSAPIGPGDAVDVPEHVLAAATPVPTAAPAADLPAPGARLSWDALQALHAGNFHGELGPFLVDF